MQVEDRVDLTSPGPRELEGLRKNWLILVAAGGVLAVLGLLAIGSSFVATLATVFVFGTLLLIGGVVQVVNAIWARQWRGFFLHLLAGVLYGIVGLLLIEHPVEAAAGLTLLVAAGLLVGGTFRIILSLVDRFDGWVWMLVGGIVSVVLGIAIWRQWPVSGLWVIGLFVGIEMLFSGWSWVMLGLAARAAPSQES